MEKLIEYLQRSYKNEIGTVKPIGKAELEINIQPDVDANDFSQKLQDELVAHIDELEIIKIDIVDSNGNLKDSFATNQ